MYDSEPSIEMCFYKKVKQSHYRPRHALRIPGGSDFQISRQSAHEGGKFVGCSTGCLHLPGNIPGSHFS